MRIAATFTTTPSCGAAGSTYCVGTMTSRPTPGSQGSTPGFASRISSYPTSKRRAMSGSVSSGPTSVFCTRPTTSPLAPSTTNLCIAVGVGSSGAAGGGATGAAGGGAETGRNSEQPEASRPASMTASAGERGRRHTGRFKGAILDLILSYLQQSRPVRQFIRGIACAFQARRKMRGEQRPDRLHPRDRALLEASSPVMLLHQAAHAFPVLGLDAARETAIGDDLDDTVGELDVDEDAVVVLGVPNALRGEHLERAHPRAHPRHDLPGGQRCFDGEANLTRVIALGARHRRLDRIQGARREKAACAQVRRAEVPQQPPGPHH